MDKVKQLVNWIKEQKISFLAYILGTIIFILGLVTSAEKDYSTTELIAESLFVFGVIVDSLHFLYRIHNTILEKILYLIFGVLTFFTYVQAESFAKQTVYTIVKANPDLFSTSVAHLSGIYFVPSFFLILASFLVLSVLSISIIFMVLAIFDATGNSEGIRKPTIHLGFYFIGFFITVYSSLNYSFNDKTNAIFGDKYALSHIIAKDYYLNKTCKNIPDVYIKYLDGNIISVTNIKDFNYPLLWNSSIDQNVTFSLMECEQTIEKNHQ